MKKRIFGFAAALLLIVGLIACGSNSNSKDSANKIDDMILKVGASSTPHAKTSERVEPLLKDEGIDFKIVKFDDYVLPNQSLEEGDIDANYFQYIPCLNKEIKEKGYNSANTSAVHIEPMGLYSRKVKDISELKGDTTIITPSFESDWERIITIPQDAGSVKVRDGVNLKTATFDDIEENSRNLKLNRMTGLSLLASTYQSDEGDLAAINVNFACGAGLNPLEDTVLLGKDNSPCTNVIAIRRGNEDSDKIKKLIGVLYRREAQEWITDE